MAEVHLLRYSTNQQIKSFQQTELPARFWANDPTGRKREYNFVDMTGREAGFVIDKGGTMKLFTENGYVRHNVDALEAILRTPGLVPPGAEFKLVNLSRVAEDNAAKRSKRVKALVKIQEQETNMDFIASMARRLGMTTVGNMSQEEVLDFVQQKAEDEPAAVLEILDSIYQKELFEFDKAKEAGIISNRNGFYMYGQLQLGVSEGSVINYFHQHPDVFADILLQNANKYGTAIQKEQADTIRLLLEGKKASAPVEVEKEPEVDPAAQLLLDQARELSIITDDEEDDALVFRHIKLSGDGSKKGKVQNALQFLMTPMNKQVREAIRKAVEQAQASNVKAK
jgi:hypothetical protein